MNAPSEPPVISRQQMIRERQKTSTFWRVVHLLASLKLALLLLATIAIACAVATFYESGFSTKIARAYIYHAPWFTVWLGVLCVNLLAVTISRWPWEKKHAAFIITHYGIILLLIGAVIGQKLGFEGNVTLHKDRPPVTRIVTSRSALQVQSPRDHALYLLPFDAEIPSPTEEQPRVLPIPDSSLSLVIDAFNNNIQRVTRLAPSPDGSPGILLKLESAMVGRTVELPFLLQPENAREQDFFGLAKIVFAPALPRETAPAPTETRMVFAKFPPVGHARGNASDVKILLNEEGSQVTVALPDGTGATYRREDAMNQPIVAGATTAHVRGYWPDFQMKNGKPVTLSNKPNNPAILVELSATTTTGEEKPRLTLAPLATGKIGYQLSRAGSVYARGEVAAGESFQLGWADWKATLVQSLPLAISTERVEPGTPIPLNEKAGVPGFHAYLRAKNGETSEPVWAESGAISELSLGGEKVSFGYGLETRPIPFSISLINFEVPRDEGTETPANFIATVKFQDSKTGETKTGTTRMNHPASFPGHWWNTFSGINYKFSQAEWNPQDLDETTLQVLYDPGWLAKWIGSLAICTGIALLFYWKPKKKSS